MNPIRLVPCLIAWASISAGSVPADAPSRIAKKLNANNNISDPSRQFLLSHWDKIEDVELQKAFALDREFKNDRGQVAIGGNTRLELAVTLRGQSATVYAFSNNEISRSNDELIFVVLVDDHRRFMDWGFIGLPHIDSFTHTMPTLVSDQVTFRCCDSSGELFSRVRVDGFSQLKIEDSRDARRYRDVINGRGVPRKIDTAL